MVSWTDELRKRVVADVQVPNQLIAMAQAYVVGALQSRAASAELLERLSKHCESEWPAKVDLKSGSDNAEVVKLLARGISVRTAGVEAICRLIHRDQLLAGGNLTNLQLHVSWQTDSGHGSGWSFPEFEIPYPSSVIRAPSCQSSELLCNDDLYLQDMDVPMLPEGVSRALRDAVQCYAADLYTPCAAMLGSASEGAWLEFGYALARHISLSDGQVGAALRKKLEDPSVSVAKKVSLVVQHYGDKTACAGLWQKSGVAPKALLPIVVWSDVVGDSRNSVHYGVDPTTPNTREKLAALLLGAVPFFRMMYSVVESVDPSS